MQREKTLGDIGDGKMTTVAEYVEERRKYLYRESDDIRVQNRMWEEMTPAQRTESEPLYFAMHHAWAMLNPNHPRNRRR